MISSVRPWRELNPRDREGVEGCGHVEGIEIGSDGCRYWVDACMSSVDVESLSAQDLIFCLLIMKKERKKISPSPQGKQKRTERDKEPRIYRDVAPSRRRDHDRLDSEGQC